MVRILKKGTMHDWASYQKAQIEYPCEHLKQDIEALKKQAEQEGYTIGRFTVLIEMEVFEDGSG